MRRKRIFFLLLVVYVFLSIISTAYNGWGESYQKENQKIYIDENGNPLESKLDERTRGVLTFQKKPLTWSFETVRAGFSNKRFEYILLDSHLGDLDYLVSIVEIKVEPLFSGRLIDSDRYKYTINKRWITDKNKPNWTKDVIEEELGGHFSIYRFILRALDEKNLEEVESFSYSDISTLFKDQRIAVLTIYTNDFFGDKLKNEEKIKKIKERIKELLEDSPFKLEKIKKMFQEWLSYQS